MNTHTLINTSFLKNNKALLHKNIQKNIPILNKNNTKKNKSLKQQFKKKNIYIIGAGPSLDIQIKKFGNHSTCIPFP